jgi:hypothetical protein
VSADFCGLARKERQHEEPACWHLYFNGCGGNIGAGKYNDGSPEVKNLLTQRIRDAMERAESNLQPVPIESASWQTYPFLLTPSAEWDADRLLARIRDNSLSVVQRNRPAFAVSYLRRFESKQPIVLSALHINDSTLLHLPAECFVEYQLQVLASYPKRNVACAAYGDGGPWYIPTAQAYTQAGYEVSVAWCGPSVEEQLTGAIKKVMPS